MEAKYLIDNVFNTANFLRDKIPQGFLGEKFFSEPTSETCQQVKVVCEQYYLTNLNPVGSSSEAKSEFKRALENLLRM